MSTPTFVVAVEIKRGVMSDFAWKADYGRATAANLENFVKVYNASMLPGGCNEHLGDAAQIVSAELIRQSSGKVVAATG